MANIPSYDEVVNYARERGFISDPAEFWGRYQNNGWKKDGRPVYNWRALFQAWEREERKRQKPPASIIHEPQEEDEWGTDEERAELIADIKRMLAIMDEQREEYQRSLEEKRRRNR